MEPILDKNFWTERYEQQQTGWDIGYPSPAIVKYMETWPDKESRILIPGAGNAYEAEYLWKQGFVNVHIADIAEAPLENFKNRVVGFPAEQCLLGDFFELEQTFDLVIEQTFYCAIQPAMRKQYAQKMHDILRPGGKLVGLLFASEFEKQGPPFGGTKEEYENCFEPWFNIIHMDITPLSIPPRQDNELWIEMVRLV